MSTTLLMIAGIIALILVVAVVGWFLLRDTGLSAGKGVKTQRIVQRFCSSDLKKRAFVVRQNNGRYKVVFQRHSDKVINLRGDVEGWQTLPEKPVAETLADAVEIAQSWAHAED